MGRPSAPPSIELPPLILGTATFNSQYNPDPYALPTTAIVHHALARGIRAFDTSPYYGPAEKLLGCALSTPFVRNNYPRDTYRLLTKVGRIGASSFDYSPSWIRQSIQRSLSRLNTSYLDVVYCHDVEFVTPEEVLAAVQELRRIRDTERTIKYVGISGYPVDVLCSLAEMVLEKTGEPLDIVMSYANFTLQNTLLGTKGLPRLLAAGVDVVPNASPLGMGLLRRKGVPVGNMGDFHPAPNGLRKVIHEASLWTEEQGEKIEVVAIRFALEAWMREGSGAGAKVRVSSHADAPDRRLGVSVMGVSSLEELDETLQVWHNIINGSNNDREDSPDPELVQLCDGTNDSIHKHHDAVSSTASSSSEMSSRATSDGQWSNLRNHRTAFLARGIRYAIGPQWVDFTWASPETGFVNALAKVRDQK